MKFRGRVLLLSLLPCATCACGAATGVALVDKVGDDGGGSDGAPDSSVDVRSTDVAVEASSCLEEVGSESLPPSCRPGGPGMTNCGACENCCASLEVTGGTYFRTYDLAADGGVTFAADGGPADEADPATVSAYRLDQYLVTVGRFRQFVAAWSGGAGYLPPAGSGRQTQLNGGLGLENSGSLGTYEMGWVASDDSNIAPTDANLACVSPYSTWTNTAGVQENLPIVCASWWEAYAFCIWDEGFLPSEAEWEYAAAGGSQQREYPWGRADPGPGTEYAIYGSAGCAPGIVPVGTATRGAGRWGQLDMAGEVQEWTLDWYAAYAACTDCAYLTPAAAQVIRGGFSASTSSDLLPARRYLNSPTDRGGNIGFRCARTP